MIKLAIPHHLLILFTFGAFKIGPAVASWLQNGYGILRRTETLLLEVGKIDEQDFRIEI